MSRGPEATRNRGRPSRRPLVCDFEHSSPSGSHVGPESGAAWPFAAHLGRQFRCRQFGLPRGLFLGILSTSSGSARSISRRAIRSINVAVVKPRRSASCAAVSTFRAKPSRLPGYVIPVPHRRCEMKDPTFVAELQKRLGAPSSETVESLRLLKAFLKLAPGQRFEIIELVERLAAEPADSDPSLS